MVKQSAVLLLYRVREGILEVFVVHPGGPFWAKKDLGAWSIPKGEIDEGEDPLGAARREFEEETGFRPEGMFRELTPVRQRSGKIVHAWAGDLGGRFRGRTSRIADMGRPVPMEDVPLRDAGQSPLGPDRPGVALAPRFPFRNNSLKAKASRAGIWRTVGVFLFWVQTGLHVLGGLV